MARPRRGTDPRKTISLRFEPDLIAFMDEVAGRHNQTRTQLAEHAIRAYLHKPGDRATAVIADLRAQLDAKVTKKPADTGVCPHPKDEQRQLSWGTLCGKCSKKLR